MTRLNRFTPLDAAGPWPRAHDAVAGREVWLQTTPLAAGGALRFLERQRAARRVTHPGWLPLLDYGLLDDASGFATLAPLPGAAPHGPLPEAEACALLARLAHVLAAVHAAGFVHLGLAPEHVWAGPAGEVTLLDAGALVPAGELADGRHVTGAPAYLPPEAIAGGPLTAASDLYALGCLAHTLLTGAPPFAGTPADVLQAQVLKPAPPLPGRAGALVGELLRKAPRERPADAAAVADRFAALAGLPALPKLPALAPTTDRLVGRAAELTTLARALDEVLAGHGRAVIVAAPAGVGKSRLVQELALHARLQHVAVAHARCREDGADPYQAVTEAWGGLLPDLTGLAKADAHAALATALAAAAATLPRLIVVDDLQWADAASLEAFNACVRATRAERVLWLFTLRPDEAPPGHGAWDAAEEGLADVVALAPFDRAGTDALLAAVGLADAPLGRLLHEATGGNPFFLGETLRHLAEDGALTRAGGGWQATRELDKVDLPEAAEAAILRRMLVLPADAAALLRLAVVFGPEPPRAALALASGLDDAAYLHALDPLVERHFLVAGDAGYRVPHDRPREAVYAAIPAAERRALHLRCGEALETTAPDGLAALAHHFTRAGDASRAHRYARAAGEQARLQAPARAIALWQAADDVLATAQGDHAAARAELAWAIGATGFELRPDLAAAALERLLAALPADAPRGLEAAAFLATAHGFAGRPLDGLEAAERALALTRGSVDPVTRAAAAMVRGPALLSAGHVDALLAVAAEARAVLAPLDPAGQPPLIRATRVGALSYQLAVCHQGLPPPPGVEEAALAAAEAAEAPNLFLTIRHYAAWRAAYAGRLDEARAYMSWAGPFGRRLGAPPHPWLLLLEALVPYQAGHMAAAAAAIERARAMPHLGRAGAIAHQLDVLAARLAGDRPALEALVAGARARGLGLGELQALIALGDAASLAAAARLAAAGPARNPLHEALALTALAPLAADPTAGLAHAERALALLAPLDLPLASARAQRAAGAAHLRLGDDAGAARVWRAAAALAATIGHAAEEQAALALLADLDARAMLAAERWAYMDPLLPPVEL